MDGFKEFQGRDLDSAIKDACSYFNASREKLEIEIIQDAKSGIFGIVGARKAKIRARRVRLRDAVESVLGGRYTHHGAPSELAAEQQAEAVEKKPVPFEGSKSQGLERKRSEAGLGDGLPSVAHSSVQTRTVSPSRGERQSGQDRLRAPVRPAAGGNDEESVSRPVGSSAQPQVMASKSVPASQQGQQVVPGESGADKCQPAAVVEPPAACLSSDPELCSSQEKDRLLVKGAGRLASTAGPALAATERSDPAGTCPEPDMGISSCEPDDAEESTAYKPLEQVDPQEAKDCALEVIRQLIRPVVDGEATLTATISDSRIQVVISGIEDCGLLIGREGMTLASVQYLASRIASRKLEAAVRIQLDVGDYRQRQDDKLREMAMALAEKVRQTGRSFSTRPLSSYHRRVVHLCLRDVEDIQTRSTGEGVMKRVVIMRRKPAPGPERSHE